MDSIGEQRTEQEPAGEGERVLRRFRYRNTDELHHIHRLDQSQIFFGLTVLCALLAIITGHIGRFQSRHHLNRDGRGMALLGILLGWLLLLVCIPAAVATVGLIAGLAVLVDALDPA